MQFTKTIQKGKRSYEIKLGSEKIVPPKKIKIPLYAKQVYAQDQLYTLAYNDFLISSLDGKEVKSFKDTLGCDPKAFAVNSSAKIVAFVGTTPPNSSYLKLFDLSGKSIKSITLKGDTPNSVAVDATGKYIVVGTGHINTQNSTIEIYTIEGKLIKAINNEYTAGGVKHVEFTNTTDFISTWHNWVHWDINGNIINKADSQSASSSIEDYATYNPQNNTYVSANYHRGSLKAFDNQTPPNMTKELITNPKAYSLWVKTRANYDKTKILNALRFEISTYDTKLNLEKSFSRFNMKEARSICSSPDNQYIYVGTDNYIEIYDLNIEKYGVYLLEKDLTKNQWKKNKLLKITDHESEAKTHFEKEKTRLGK